MEERLASCRHLMSVVPGGLPGSLRLGSQGCVLGTPHQPVNATCWGPTVKGRQPRHRGLDNSPKVGSVLLAWGSLQTRDVTAYRGPPTCPTCCSPTCLSPAPLPALSPTSLIGGLTFYFQPDLGPEPQTGTHIDSHTPAPSPISEWHCPHQWLKFNLES